MIEKLKTWKPIKGDDSPFYTIFLRDVPNGYGFDSITNDATLIKQSEIWESLIDYAKRYYSDYELNARTLTDFKNLLQLVYDGHKNQFEFMLDNIDLLQADFGQSTTKTTTRNKSTNSENERTMTKNQATENNGTTENITLAFDSSNEEPTDKSVGTNREDITSRDTDNTTNEGTETETYTERIDIDRFYGENPFDMYDRLMMLYPSIYDVFVKYFENCFTLKEVMIW